jgi:hypothetical protein
MKNQVRNLYQIEKTKLPDHKKQYSHACIESENLGVKYFARTENVLKKKTRINSQSIPEK